MQATSLFRRKSIDDFNEQADAEHGLQRSIGTWQLALIGVGCTIGTGIFFIFESAVPKAGPAIVISFVIASIVAAFTALCYAEIASALPVSGSSYSYAYATMGEIVAFDVAVLLLFEYAISAAAVAVGWGEYVDVLFHDATGIDLPTWATHAPTLHSFGFNIPAVALILICGFLLSRGTKESALANTIMVCIKVGILLFFAVVAALGFHASNFHPFMPNGWSGVAAAGGSVFFTFIGIDAVCTAGAETKNPQKSLPRAMIIALVIVTGCYILVAIAAVGAQKWSMFQDQEAALAVIVENILHAQWPGELLAVCAIISIFSCTLVTMFGQTRILYAMGEDGMLPKSFATVNKHHAPHINTWIVTIACALMAAVMNLDILADLVSMGTLLSFAIVSVGVIVLRKREPDRPRGFKVPLYPVLPILSVLACLYLVCNLSWITWLWCAFVVGVGMLYYFLYSRKHSVLGHQLAAAELEGKREAIDALEPRN